MKISGIVNNKSASVLPCKVGNKAFNLFRLGKENFPVPPWICLDSDFFESKLDVGPLFKNYDLNHPDKIKMASEEIKKLILDLSLSIDIKLEGPFFAVRSSAIGEDGEDFSFAGQLSSFLFVPENEVEKAIKDCWVSAYSERVLQYLSSIKRKGPLKVAVIIQEMVEGEKSGIMFTANPLSRLKELIVTAGYGIGEGVVSDQVETDTYTMSSGVVKKETTPKRFQFVKSGERGGVCKVSVPKNLQNRNVLDELELKDLSRLGCQIEKLYSCPQDIEWVMKKGKVFITQTRPITALKKEDQYFFDNSNIVESFPGVNTPLTLSVVKVVYSNVFYNVMKTMGIPKKRLQGDLFQSLLGFYEGRVFYNLTHWYKMMRLVPFMEAYIKVWEESLGVEKNKNSIVKKEKAVFIFKAFLAIKIFSRMGAFFLFLGPILKKLDSDLKEVFSNFGLSRMKSSREALQQIETLKKEIFKKWEYTLFNDIFAFSFSSFSKFLLKKTKINTEKVFNDLLCGQGEMESVAPIKSIIELVDIVRSDSSIKYELKAQVSSEGDVYFSNTLFRNKFEKHLDLFGDRGVEELKLETVSFRERPQKLVKLILDYLETDISLEEMRKKDLESRLNLERSFKYRPIRKITFYISFWLAKRSIVFRENFRLHRSRAYGILRTLFNEIGRDLFKNGVIDDSKDIFYLKLEEISDFLKGMDSSRDLKKIIELRKNEQSLFEKRKVHEKYTFDGFKFSPHQKKNCSKKNILKGRPCSSGSVKGEVLVVHNLKDVENARLLKGKILVAPMTDPGWVYLMNLSAGLIVEKGSILSHTAIIGRELGIPTIVTVPQATSLLKTGDKIEMDGETGIISRQG